MHRGGTALLCFEGASASTVAGPLEVFGHAASCQRNLGQAASPLAVTLVTPDGAPALCDGCITVEPAGPLDAISKPDLVLLAGMSSVDLTQTLRCHDGVARRLAALHRGGATVAAVCASQSLLAEAGLLDGRSAAIHWSLIDEFRQRWPAVKWTADRLVVEDAGLYTCCGADAARDLALCLVDRFCGTDVMMECARWFLTDLPRVRPNVPPPLFAVARPGDPTMRRVEEWLQANYSSPVRFEALAAKFGMSWRTFHRHFREAFGDPPKMYVQKLRLDAARRILEGEAMPIDAIARKVGYDDPVFFRTLFKRFSGMTPSVYRERFHFRALVRTRPPDGQPGA